MIELLCGTPLHHRVYLLINIQQYLSCMEIEVAVGVGLDSYVTAMSDLVFQGVFRGTEYHDNITFVTKTFYHASHLS